MPAPRRTAVVVLTILATLVVSAPGHASDWATKAQRRLNVLGCNAGPVDGTVGTRTRTGIIRFQAANRLPQTGSLNDTTTRRLYGARQVHCDRRPVPGAGAGGRRIVLSQKQNYVWLVRSGGAVVAQGGIVDNPRSLRAGSYRSGPKCGRAGRIRNNSDASGRLRLHNFTRFAPCGIGFHQIPQYRSSGAQIHPDFLLGTDYRESHGCIRVSRQLSGRIWAFATTGTKVVVLR
jgi:Putative peptidoglycan binding domain/L,D-transpeptidase catalytic domain